MKKPIRTLVIVAASVLLVALAACVVFISMLTDAVNEDGRRALCDALLQGRRVGPPPPFLAYKADDLKRGPKVVWTFRKELAQDEKALAQMKAQAQRCNVEFVIQTNPS